MIFETSPYLLALLIVGLLYNLCRSLIAERDKLELAFVLMHLRKRAWSGRQLIDTIAARHNVDIPLQRMSTLLRQLERQGVLTAHEWPAYDYDRSRDSRVVYTHNYPDPPDGGLQ